MHKINWRSIASQNLQKAIGGEASGVYSWHYNMRFSKHDMDIFVKYVLANRATETERKNNKSYIVNFLNEKLFSFFKYPNYLVSMTGPLLPKYSGNISHEIGPAVTIIDRLYENPTLIYGVSESLAKISPEFSNPLYIGMASNLSRRIVQHKEMLLGLKENYLYSFSPEITDGEKSFAERVQKRGFILENLFVCVEPVPNGGALNNIVENIMNRINYPVLGRN